MMVRRHTTQPVIGSKWWPVVTVHTSKSCSSLIHAHVIKSGTVRMSFIRNTVFTPNMEYSAVLSEYVHPFIFNTLQLNRLL